MKEVRNYDLPDHKLLESEENTVLVWIPEKTCIVLGASNNPETSLIAENVIADNIIVYKRNSGGQAVVLTPNVIAISKLFVNSGKLQPKTVFKEVNSQIISVLENLDVKNLSHEGISDIAISGKKILGSSIYRFKEKLLYHAVLNFAEPTSTFERYLKHPLKEPDYRKGRSHSDFVTSLQKEGYCLSANEIIAKATNVLVESITL
jgi:lipoate-protein ligase A